MEPNNKEGMLNDEECTSDSQYLPGTEETQQKYSIIYGSDKNW